MGVLFTRDGSRKVLVGIEGGVYVYTDMAAMGDLFSSETFTSDMSADQAAAVLVKSFLRDGLTLEYDRGSMTTDDLLAKLQSDSSKEDDVDESATASGTGAGRSEWSSSFVGTWALYGVSVDGQMISHDDLVESGMAEEYSLVLDDDGTGVLCSSGEEGEITWEAVSDDEITVKDGVDSVTCTLEGDRLTMKGPDGYEIIFERS